MKRLFVCLSLVFTVFTFAGFGQQKGSTVHWITTAGARLTYPSQWQLFAFGDTTYLYYSPDGGRFLASHMLDAKPAFPANGAVLIIRVLASPTDPEPACRWQDKMCFFGKLGFKKTISFEGYADKASPDADRL